jgi:hypothetical protein
MLVISGNFSVGGGEVLRVRCRWRPGRGWLLGGERVGGWLSGCLGREFRDERSVTVCGGAVWLLAL